jgi:hypothetical protein
MAKEGEPKGITRKQFLKGIVNNFLSLAFKLVFLYALV